MIRFLFVCVFLPVFVVSCGQQPGNPEAYQGSSNLCSSTFVSDTNKVSSKFSIVTSDELTEIENLINEYAAKYKDVTCKARLVQSHSLESPETVVNANQQVQTWRDELAAMRTKLTPNTNSDVMEKLIYPEVETPVIPKDVPNKENSSCLVQFFKDVERVTVHMGVIESILQLGVSPDLETIKFAKLELADFQSKYPARPCPEETQLTGPQWETLIGSFSTFNGVLDGLENQYLNRRVIEVLESQESGNLNMDQDCNEEDILQSP